MTSKLSLFLAELKRRKVYRVAVVYALVGLAVAQGADWAFDLLELPNVASQLAAILLAFGFPIALVLAWAYEVKPEEPREQESATPATLATPDTEQPKSIVVLPFDNMSPDPGDAYFADGLTEEVITNLSHIHSLRVISRNSAMVLKGTQKSTGEIAEELKVQYLLEGSVRKAGNDLRITAQLIDASSDEHLWAEKYDGVLEDVFGMQESVSRSIVEALELRLTSPEEQRIGERRIDNIQAYEWFLKAQGEILRATPDALQRAQQYLDTASEITGPNPYLYAGMAFAHWQQANIGLAQEDAIALADDYVSKALALDPGFPLALAIRGVMDLAFRGKPQEAVVHLKRSLATNPDESFSLGFLAVAYVYYAGKTEAASPLIARLQRIDPLAVVTPLLRGALPFFQGHFRKASEEWRRLAKMTSDSPVFRFHYAWAVAYAGDLPGALDVLKGAGPPEGADVGSRLHRLLKCALQNDREGALQELTPDVRKTVNRDGSWAHFAAAPLAFVGAVDEAIELLEHGVRRGGFINYPMLAEYDPFLAKLRGDPRYEALVEEAKQAWETFEV